MITKRQPQSVGCLFAANGSRHFTYITLGILKIVIFKDGFRVIAGFFVNL